MSRLILLRHGQSVWNQESRFTGWVDVPLAENGEKEAKAAAVAMRQENIEPENGVFIIFKARRANFADCSCPNEPHATAGFFRLAFE